jgi:ribosomal protein S18 acetylase RimI-like enzyme
MTVTPGEILALEDISARAWPPARRARIGGWRLNAASGHSGRINACWPLAGPGLETRLAIGRTEAWYSGQGLPARFKIVDRAHAPADLTGALAGLGYRAHTETVMMVGPAGGDGDGAAIIEAGLSEDFAAVFAAAGEDPGDTRERIETLGRVPAPRAFARIDVAGAPAAIGACGVEADWAGIFAMRTAAARRRQGLARRVLAALLAWAGQAGARRAWLQVEADNAAALALYAAAGFAEAYRYRYWSRSDPGA